MKKVNESVNVKQARRIAEHISVEIQKALAGVNKEDRRAFINQLLVSLKATLK